VNNKNKNSSDVVVNALFASQCSADEVSVKRQLYKIQYDTAVNIFDSSHNYEKVICELKEAFGSHFSGYFSHLYAQHLNRQSQALKISLSTNSINLSSIFSNFEREENKKADELRELGSDINVLFSSFGSVNIVPRGEFKKLYSISKKLSLSLDPLKFNEIKNYSLLKKILSYESYSYILKFNKILSEFMLSPQYDIYKRHMLNSSSPNDVIANVDNLNNKYINLEIEYLVLESKRKGANKYIDNYNKATEFISSSVYPTDRDLFIDILNNSFAKAHIDNSLILLYLNKIEDIFSLSAYKALIQQLEGSEFNVSYD
jgi:hypothetical protein